MNSKYGALVTKAVNSFWRTKKEQGNVLAGRQLDAFLALLKKVAMDSGVPRDCIHLKNNHVPGYYRATKDWDLIIVSRKGNLIAAIELKSQVGSYGNNLNNRTEEALGSAEDFWVAFRERSFSCRQTPWLGYMMVVGKDEQSIRQVRVSEPHFAVRPEFKGTTYLAVSVIATSGEGIYESLDDNISVESFLNAFRGHLIGNEDEFK
ncbi:MAG: PaeR7I family type II restriction endonuclease [Kiritimatiellia bacterium]